jgi:hypothetical protein
LTRALCFSGLPRTPDRTAFPPLWQARDTRGAPLGGGARAAADGRDAGPARGGARSVRRCRGQRRDRQRQDNAGEGAWGRGCGRGPGVGPARLEDLLGASAVRRRGWGWVAGLPGTPPKERFGDAAPPPRRGAAPGARHRAPQAPPAPGAPTRRARPPASLNSAPLGAPIHSGGGYPSRPRRGGLGCGHAAAPHRRDLGRGARGRGARGAPPRRTG